MFYSSVLAVLFFSQIQSLNGSAKFTNIKCASFYISFCEFKQCELKVLGRSKIGLSLDVAMKDFKMHNMTINMALYKRANGYKPFLFNVTFDFCDYKRHPKRYPYFYLVEQAFIKYSNVNHTCPYRHDIRVKDWVLRDNMFEKLPLPTGNYMFRLLYGTNGIWRAITEVFLERIESFKLSERKIT